MMSSIQKNSRKQELGSTKGVPVVIFALTEVVLCGISRVMSFCVHKLRKKIIRSNFSFFQQQLSSFIDVRFAQVAISAAPSELHHGPLDCFSD